MVRYVCLRFGLVVVATTSRRDNKDQMFRPLVGANKVTTKPLELAGKNGVFRGPDFKGRGLCMWTPSPLMYIYEDPTEQTCNLHSVYVTTWTSQATA
jgi:hypothetical protein